MLNVILIGERVNGGTGSSAWQRIYDDPHRYWEIMRRHGAFKWHRSPQGQAAERRCWRQLRSILGEDLDINYAMNLLKPSQMCGSWSVNEASKAAECLVGACPRPSLIIACGTRVAKAIAKKRPFCRTYPQAPGAIVGQDGLWLTRIPHPSGRNPQWSNGEFVTEIADRLKVNLELLKQELLV